MRSQYLPSRRWRSWKAVWALFAVEFLFTIPALALFAIAQPNLYRTKLWKDGFDNGFNSNPLAPIYAMVNGEVFVTPIVWRQLYVHSFPLNLETLVVQSGAKTRARLESKVRGRVWN